MINYDIGVYVKTKNIIDIKVQGVTTLVSWSGPGISFSLNGKICGSGGSRKRAYQDWKFKFNVEDAEVQSRSEDSRLKSDEDFQVKLLEPILSFKRRRLKSI
mgnify:CR=1 FL=1